jgi:AGZA family xanthine/uracil permease-like MFS transporter
MEPVMENGGPKLGSNGEAVTKPRGIYWLFIITSAGTLVSSTFGGIPVIILGESFAGVLYGGKTGLTAISTGLFFMIGLPFSPILSKIPLYASAPVLLLLGVHLFSHLDINTWKAPGNPHQLDLRWAVPAFCTVVLMPFLYSIDKAIIAGMAAHAVMWCLDTNFNGSFCLVMLITRLLPLKKRAPVSRSKMHQQCSVTRRT